ncbi:MAG TPA: hypothetical protein VKQ29_14815 [Aliidongia sp.]|nr:hypothetical protein [Aliidongia sp.]
MTITKSITIDCQGVLGGVLVSAGNGISVNVPTGSFVQLKGLDIDGLNNSSAGVAMLNSGFLAIENCTIYGFTYGVYVNGLAGARVTVDDTKIRKNTNGVYILPQGGVSNGVNINRTIVDASTTANLTVSPGTTVRLSDSSLTGSPVAVSSTGGTVDSYGNNRIDHLGTVTLTALALQ